MTCLVETLAALELKTMETSLTIVGQSIDQVTRHLTTSPDPAGLC